MNRLVVSLGMVAILFFVHAGEAQTTGGIAGFVQDETKAVVPGVDVQAVQEGTGLSRSAITAENGTYTIPLLPPGK